MLEALDIHQLAAHLDRRVTLGRKQVQLVALLHTLCRQLGEGRVVCAERPPFPARDDRGRQLVVPGGGCHVSSGTIDSAPSATGAAPSNVNPRSEMRRRCPCSSAWSRTGPIRTVFPASRVRSIPSKA